MIDDFKSAINDIIDNLDASVTRNSFAMRQYLILLMQNIDIVSANITKNSFGELNNTQKDFFNKLNFTISKWNEGTEITIGSVNDTLKMVNDITARLPGADKTPRVISYTPAYVINGEDTKVSIEGTLIGDGNPTLYFDNIACGRLTKDDYHIVFDCPGKIFSSSDEIKGKSGKLKLFSSQKKWVFFPGDEKIYNYDLGIYIIPEVMGSYKIDAIVENKIKETRQRTESFDHKNPHCESSQKKITWTVNADIAGGWKIDPTSVKPKVNHRGKKSYFNGVFDKTESGFQLRAVAQNHGKCTLGGLLGGLLGKDARGGIGVSVTFNEYKYDTLQETISIESGTLKRNEEKIIKLPKNHIRPIIEITQMNNSKLVANGKLNEKWFDIVYDSGGGLVMIKPKSLDKALK